MLLDDLWSQSRASKPPNMVPLEKNVVLLVLWLHMALGTESNKNYPWSMLNVFCGKQRTKVELRPRGISTVDFRLERCKEGSGSNGMSDPN